MIIETERLILRPFLEITRAELAEYAAAHHIPHVEDETNADPEAAARLYALIGGLNRQQGMTVIMISHDTDAVLRHASRVLHLGEVPFCGSPDVFRQRFGPSIFAGQAEGGEAL